MLTNIQLELELCFEVVVVKGNLLSELGFVFLKKLKLNFSFSRNRSRSHHVSVEESANSMNLLRFRGIIRLVSAQGNCVGGIF